MTVRLAHIGPGAGRPTGKNTRVITRFVESNNSVLFDTNDENGSECRNISVDSAKELIKALEVVVAEAEAFAARPVVKNSPMVKYKGITYYFNEGYLVVNKPSPTRLMEAAVLVIDEAGYILKNRHA